MPGKRINQRQVRIYMESRKQGKSQETASAKAGISERSGRKIDQQGFKSIQKRPHDWRTREDPFADVWESEIEPMLKEAPTLLPQTLFEYLQKQHPGRYPDSKKRTFQRRVKLWKAVNGNDKEVMFRQDQQAGRMGISDFTELKEAEITVQGESLNHRLYHFRLAFSGWSDVKVILGGESYTALAEGLQNALWKLGGSPMEHRTDSLSAAYLNLTKNAGEDMTRRYESLCRHYRMKATRNNRGCGHENGAIESPHGHLKRRISQGLLLRGGCDFATVNDYQGWLDGITKEINNRRRDHIEIERRYLQVLPQSRTADYTEKVARVTTSSTISVKRVLYTVPSRLIGASLRLHIYDDRIDGFMGVSKVISLSRSYVSDHNRRARSIDYRHVIDSLERKPQAFRYSQLRDELLPDERYRAVWQWLDQAMEPRAACKMIVGILSIAHRFDCEHELGEYLISLQQSQRLPTLSELQERFGKRASSAPSIKMRTEAASEYDKLLSFNFGKAVNQ